MQEHHSVGLGLAHADDFDVPDGLSKWARERDGCTDSLCQRHRLRQPKRQGDGIGERLKDRLRERIAEREWVLLRQHDRVAVGVCQHHALRIHEPLALALNIVVAQRVGHAVAVCDALILTAAVRDALGLSVCVCFVIHLALACKLAQRTRVAY